MPPSEPGSGASQETAALVSTTIDTTPAPEARATDLVEILKRDTGARLTAWRHGEHVARPPLVLVPLEHAAGFVGTRAPIGVLLDESDATAPDGIPSVRLLGGFHRHLDGSLEGFEAPGSDALFDFLSTDGPGAAAGVVDATVDPQTAWADAILDRARRIEGLLALRHAPRPVHDAQLDEEDDGGSDENAAEAALADQVFPDPVIANGGAVAVWPEATSAGGDPALLAPRLLAARRAAGGHRLLYAPGIGLPHEVALLLYAGVDLVDAHAVTRAAFDGFATTPDGPVAATDLTEPMPAPPGLPGTTDGLVVPAELDRQGLIRLNIAWLVAELLLARGCIQRQTLREHVETRARARPETVAFLRHLDAAGHEQLSAQIPLSGTGRVLATTMEALQRPGVRRFRERLVSDYAPPEGADVLLLLPCSARKPYRTSRSHRSFRRAYDDLYAASRVHEVIVTSPLGVVPRELETVWPAAHYDVPVTGQWDAEERLMIRQQVEHLLSHGAYRHVVSHLGPATHALVEDLLPEGTVHTGTPHPMRFEARMKMRDALFAACSDGVTAPRWPQRRLAEAKAHARWQYGKAAAEALFSEADGTQGRAPATRILKGGRKGRQIAQVVPQKGLLVLTMTGAEILHEAGCLKEVEIDDFVPRGTIFAVGVRAADPSIAIGEEVAIVHDGRLRGVGLALATGDEMPHLGRGGCVEVKHHV